MKKIAVLLACVLIALSVVGCTATKPAEPTEAETVAETEIETEAITEAETETEQQTEAETVDHEAIEKEFKEKCETVSYKKLARNPDKYDGKNLKFTGEVIQVIETGYADMVYLRINVTKKEYEYLDPTYTDTIYAIGFMDESGDRILEDDIITIWGLGDGLETYETVMGGTVTLPKVSFLYYEIETEND